MGQTFDYRNLRLVKMDVKEDITFLEFVDEKGNQVKLSAMGTNDNPLPDFVREDGDYHATMEEYFSEAKGKTYQNLSPSWRNRKKVGWKISPAGDTVGYEGMGPKPKPAPSSAPASTPRPVFTPRTNVSDDARQKYWENKTKHEQEVEGPQKRRCALIEHASRVAAAMINTGKIQNAVQARVIAECMAQDWDTFVVTGKTEKVNVEAPEPIPEAKSAQAKLPGK